MAWYTPFVDFFTDPNASGSGVNPDWSNIALLGGLGALLSNDKVKDFVGLGGGSSQPVGYQGGIPKYTATRTALPMVDTNLQNSQIRDWATQYGMNPDIQLAEAQKAMGQGTSFDQLMGYAAQRGKPYTPKEAMPSRRPGSGGRRYFSDVQYSIDPSAPVMGGSSLGSGITSGTAAGTGATTGVGTTAGITRQDAGLIAAQGYSTDPAVTFASSGDPLLDAYRQAFYGTGEGQYRTQALTDSIQAIATQNPNMGAADYLLNYGIAPSSLYSSGAGSAAYDAAGTDSALYQQLYGGGYRRDGAEGTFDTERVYKEAYDKNPDATVFDTSLGRNVSLFEQAPLGGIKAWNPSENRYALAYTPSLADIKERYGLQRAMNAALGLEQDAGYYSTDFDKAAEALGIPVETIRAEAEKRPEYVVYSRGENFVRNYTGDPADFVPQEVGEQLGRKYLGNNKVEYYSPDSPVFQSYARGGLMSLPQSRGYYLGGPTDGMADRVPARIDGRQEARLSDGEFVMPADIVSHLGNGNSEAGAKVLYDMMDRVRKARTGTTQQGRQINPNKFTPV